MSGGDGADNIIGGAGADVLSGNFANGAGDTFTDTFWFTDKTDSGVTVATRDLIGDFEDTVDVIDVSKIDANSVSAGNQDFAFIGVDASFTKVAGQMRVYHTVGGWIIDADITGDGKADFAIGINDPTHAMTISSADIIGG